MDKDRQTVFSILMMRFELDPYTAIPVTNRWFRKHPNKSWGDLKISLLGGEVIFKNNKLHDVDLSEIKALTQKMRGKYGVEIKDRWYNLKRYRQCFIGSEAVKWLMKTQNSNKEEAIKLGQMLLDRGIIHHVHDDHNFKNEFLFYRFYDDEIATNQNNETNNLGLKNMLANI